MKIKKVTYVKVQFSNKSKILPKRKAVLEKVEDDCYIGKEYAWSREEKAWMPLVGCAFFDGKELHDTGLVRMRTNKDVDRYFELLVKYEGFSLMDDSEESSDPTAEIEYIRELNSTDVE